MHLRDAYVSALRFVKGRSRPDLDQEEMRLFALVGAIAIMDRAAGKVSASTQAACPERPWRDMVGIRHRLVHSYLDVDKDKLWITAQHDLKFLLNLLGEQLRSPKT